MKKRNNKVIILALTGIIFAVLLGIFILNYSKDDYSFSILEKKWINDNTSNIIDVNIYNDVPIFGKNGKGVAFDILDEFTKSYGISFNKISYSISSTYNQKTVSFKILDATSVVGEENILLYEDYYVLVSNETTIIDDITDINNTKLAVLSKDLSAVSNYLPNTQNISYLAKEDIAAIHEAFTNKEVNYAVLPYNLYIDFILENNLNILYKLSDISKKYVLTSSDKTLLNILNKYYLKFQKENSLISYNKHFLNEFFIEKGISEVDRMGYNGSPYNVGFVTYMPFEGVEGDKAVGTLSNYLNGFEDLFNVDLNLIAYTSIAELKRDLSAGELDLVFANFSDMGLNIDTIHTSSLFKEEYVILSKDTFVVKSVKSLKNMEVITIKDSYINNMLINNGITCKTYNNTDELLRNVRSNSVIVIDKATYDYYKVRKFTDYNELYTGNLPYQYNFLIRDVNKNQNFAEMFTYYVSIIDYNEVKFEYNTNVSNYNSKSLTYFIISVTVLLLIVLAIIIIRKRRKNENILRNNEKLKYIDTMTSLKNRAYLNCKIAEWDENVIYPQGFVVIDLNNIKDINDNHGHEEGDTVIKKAASVLIVNQASNTDIIRTDGTEFLIYMVGYQEKDVIAYTRKIYKELKELPYGYGATIGYSMIMDDVKTVDDAINEATIDMRKKKEQVDINGQNIQN